MRTVRLRAPRDDLVRRGATLLEDALRTASRPDAGGRRLLIVRSLVLGAIEARRGAAVVALDVERRLHDVASRAVHALDASAPARDVVYFRDDVEAYVALAVRVATQRPTDAWFWRLAVPRWRPGTPRDEALRSLLFGVIETPAGAAAGAALLDSVEEAGAIDPLLGALRAQDGGSLLSAFGWGGATPAGGSDNTRRTVPALPASRMRALGQWAGRWGGDDSRSVWLAGALLLAARPVRALEPTVRDLASALVTHTLEHQVSAFRRAARSASVRDDGELRAIRAAADSARPPVEAARPVVDARAARAAPPVQQADRIDASGVDEDSSPPVPPVSPSASPVQTQDRVVSAVEAGEVGAPAPATDDHSPPPHRDTSAGADSPDDSTVRAADSFAADGERPPRIAADHGTPQPAARVEEPGAGTPEQPRRAGPDDGGDERPTAYAGLFLLLPLATRLGMPSFLAAHPELIEYDFPTLLLRRVAERLSVAVDDPALVSLPPADGAALRWDGDFVAPESWSHAVAGPRATWLVRRTTDLDGDERRALTDGSWRLVLALWRGRAPAAVRAMRAGTAVSRGRSLGVSPAMEILLGSWITAMRRWCHRHAGMGLRTLVARPGRVASTRTHLDVLFAMRQLDIRVRRAGLDIDPGWLPWFGRVVAYHYASGERGDAR